MKTPSVLDLRPTQFVLGMKEVESKVRQMSKFNKAQMAQYCTEHEIPVVLGPAQQIYMIDHHHFARACWEVGVKDFTIQVLKDLSDLDDQKFWNFMVRKNWTYLHDQFGMGPHLPNALPTDIRCLADDPYRSLAWAVREEGAIRKVDEPFFEFKWAAFFRQNLGLRLFSKSDFRQAIRIATKLALSKDASELPGFAGSKGSKKR